MRIEVAEPDLVDSPCHCYSEKSPFHYVFEHYFGTLVFRETKVATGDGRDTYRLDVFEFFASLKSVQNATLEKVIVYIRRMLLVSWAHSMDDILTLVNVARFGMAARSRWHKAILLDILVAHLLNLFSSSPDH